MTPQWQKRYVRRIYRSLWRTTVSRAPSSFTAHAACARSATCVCLSGSGPQGSAHLHPGSLLTRSSVRCMSRGVHPRWRCSRVTGSGGRSGGHRGLKTCPVDFVGSGSSRLYGRYGRRTESAATKCRSRFVHDWTGTGSCSRESGAGPTSQAPWRRQLPRGFRPWNQGNGPTQSSGYSPVRMLGRRGPICPAGVCPGHLRRGAVEPIRARSLTLRSPRRSAPFSPVFHPVRPLSGPGGRSGPLPHVLRFRISTRWKLNWCRPVPSRSRRRTDLGGRAVAGAASGAIRSGTRNVIVSWGGVARRSS